MSFLDVVKEKGAELAGKLGIAGGVTAEAGKAVGMFDNVSAFQVVSAAGVIWLMIDRSFRLLWDAKENGTLRLTACTITFMWTLFIIVLLMVI